MNQEKENKKRPGKAQIKKLEWPAEPYCRPNLPSSRLKPV